MSHAFIKEQDEQLLHEIQPTVNALIVYLTRQNNGIRVYEQTNIYSDKYNATIYHMSNGLDYVHNAEGKWMMIL